MNYGENAPLEDARKGLEAILLVIPNARVDLDVYLRSDQPNLASMVDFTATVKTNHHEYTLAVDFKQQGHPKQLRAAIDRLLRFRNRTGRPDYLVVAAPHITSEGAAMCREDNIGYFDLSGNCRLAFGYYFIERTGNPDRKKTRTQTAYLYGRKSERVLRILLASKERSWRILHLADQAKVSTGLVAVIRRLLLERDWAIETSEGFRMNRPVSLLKDWATVWARRPERADTYFTLQNLAKVEVEMAEFARQRQQDFAITGKAGAWRMAPMVSYNRIQAYWNGDPGEFAHALGLRTSGDGSNIQLIKPRDEGVFYNCEQFDGVPTVSPLQLYLDLNRDPARGAEAAEHLLTSVLKLEE